MPKKRSCITNEERLWWRVWEINECRWVFRDLTTFLCDLFMISAILFVISFCVFRHSSCIYFDDFFSLHAAITVVVHHLFNVFKASFRWIANDPSFHSLSFKTRFYVWIYQHQTHERNGNHKACVFFVVLLFFDSKLLQCIPFINAYVFVFYLLYWFWYHLCTEQHRRSLCLHSMKLRLKKQGWSSRYREHWRRELKKK